MIEAGELNKTLIYCWSCHPWLQLHCFMGVTTKWKTDFENNQNTFIVTSGGVRFCIRKVREESAVILV